MLEAEPGAADVVNSLGLVLEKKGREAEAEAHYRRAADVDPDAAEPRANLGNLARSRGDLDAAEAWYRSAIEADPYFMGAYNNLALVYQDRGDDDKAIELYDRALAKSPDHAVVLNNLGSIFFERGDVEDARRSWSRAAALDPRYPSPLNNLAGLEISEGNLEAARGRLLRALERATYHAADMVISTNESYRQVAIERGGVPPERVFVVRSGPSRERFATLREPDASLRRGRRHLVAYLGVMAPQDGVDHLLRAARILADRGRDDVAYTLVGAGDSFEELRAMARGLGLGDAVEFTGRVPDETVERILATADVCVVPDPLNPLNDVSTMNKVLEYMACGRPMAAYDLREHRYSAGEGALYAEPNREDRLADRIAELLDDPALRERMGAYNRKRFLEAMAWEYSAGELLRAYRTLCGPNRNG